MSELLFSKYCQILFKTALKACQIFLCPSEITISTISVEVTQFRLRRSFSQLLTRFVRFGWVFFFLYYSFWIKLLSFQISPGRKIKWKSMMKLKLLGSKNQPLFGRRDQASLPREGSEGAGQGPNSRKRRKRRRHKQFINSCRNWATENPISPLSKIIKL